MFKHKIAGCAALVTLLVTGGGGKTGAQTPLLEYKFNETGTAAADSGSLASNLNFQNAAGAAADLHSADALGVSGKPGDRALDFTSATQMGANGTGPLAVTTGANPVQNQAKFTITGWFKASSVFINKARLLDANGFNVLASNDTSTSGLLRLQINNTDGSPAGSNVAYGAVNQWVFFALTFDGTIGANQIKCYVGTKSSATTPAGVSTLSGVTLGAGTDALNIGNRTDKTRPFKGLLDDFRIYSGVLTPLQMETLRQNDAGISTTSPYIYRINCGGVASGPLAADNYYSGATSAASNANSTIIRTSVSNPMSEDIYRDVRTANPGAPITYTFPGLIPNLPYRVRLHFFEMDNLFSHTQSVAINGKSCLQNFDIGGTNKVSVHDCTANADIAGNLSVVIYGGNGSPMISALEVLNVKVYYVAPNGNDSWSGSLASPYAANTDGPFATLSRAKSAIQSLKLNAQFDRPVTVYVRGGTYYLPTTLAFTPDDSGSGVNRIVYEAYPGETPIISGGRPITGWTNVTVNGKAAWRIMISEVASGNLYFRELWVNGQRRSRARTPNVGFYQIQSGQPGKATGHNDRSFVYRGTDLDTLGDISSADAVLLAQWTSSHLPLTGLDTSTKTLTFSKETAFGLGNGERYWIENTPNGLDQPGEWYLQKSSGDLYYIPKTGETIANTTAVAPTLENIVRFDGDPASSIFITDLVFRGLTFSNTQWWFPNDFRAGGPGLGDPLNTWTLGIFENAGFNAGYARVGLPGAILANGLTYATFERNTIRSVAGYGIELRDGDKNDRIDGNRITDVGGGIKLGRRDFNGQGPLETTDIIVSDNTISDGGHRFTGAVGMSWCYARNNLITHNEIFDFNYSGLGAGSIDSNDINGTGGNSIVFNNIHHAGQNRNFSPNAPVMGDLGGIYIYGTQPGTLIDNNALHHVTGEYGGHGIYLDQGSKQVTVRNNVAYRSVTDNFFSWLTDTAANSGVFVENNIFAFSPTGQFTIGYFDTGYVTVRRNIVYYAGGGQDKDPTLYGNMYWYGSRGNLISDYNLYYNVNGNGYWANSASSGDFNVADAGFQSYFLADQHSVFQNPQFVDPNNDDYRLKPQSPIFQAGTPAYNLGFNAAAIKYDFGPRASVSLTGTVTLDGIADLSATALPLDFVTVTFRLPGSVTPLVSQTVALVPTGVASQAAFTVSMPPGTYDVAIKTPRNLQVVVPNVTLTAPSKSLPTVIALPGGDANNDNTVDIADFGLLVNAYGGQVSVPGSGYDIRADFNSDGVIDIADFGILVNSYGNSGAP